MPTSTVPPWEFAFPVPDSNEALSELLEDPARMAEVQAVWSVESVPNISAHMAAARSAADTDHEHEQMGAQMDAEFDAVVQAQGGHVEGSLDLNPRAMAQLQEAFNQAHRAHQRETNPYYNPAAPGAAIDNAGIWDSYSDMLRSVFAFEQPRDATGWHDFQKMQGAAAAALNITNAYSSHIGEDGGFLIPEAFRAQLLRVALEEGVVRGRATVIPMSTAKVTIPAIHETSRASTLFGGVQMYWTDEESDATESGAKFMTVTLEPNTLTGYAEVPLELLADGVATDAFFGSTYPAAMAYETDYEFLQGTGVGRPAGALKADCLVTVAKEAGQAADTVEVENLAKMWARLPASSMQRAVWVVNQEVLPQLLTMSDASGNQPIWAMNIANGQPGTILGRPVVVSEKVNALGDKGDVLLADFSYYLIGDRQAMTVTTSDHVAFKGRRRAFLITERVDGRPWLKSAVTPRKGSGTLSPFVTLAERA